MPSPYKFEIKTVTNDVISSKELPLKFQGTNAKGKPLNAYRVDYVEVLIPAFAGIATADYFIVEFDYENLNGDALAQLKELNSKPYIERRVRGPFSLLGTNGNLHEDEDPAKKPLRFDFKNCFIIETQAWMNFLAHGLASARDSQFVIWGNYVHVPPDNMKRLDSGVTLN